MGHLRGLGLILLAALLAAGAGLGFYMRVKAVAPTRGATVPLVVAAKDITFGTKLEPQDLRLAEFPVDAVPNAAYSSPDSILGHTTKVFLVKGEAILASKLSSVGGGLSVRIPESMRASSVNVNEVSGVSGFILPGDRVDVIVTIDRVGEMRSSVAKTILQDVEILAAGIKTESKNEKPLDVQSVTLLVDPRGAEDLALAIHEGKIHLVLRNPVDRNIANVKPATTQEIMGLSDAVRRAPAAVVRRPAPPQPQPAPPAPAAMAQAAPAPEPSYTIIRDGRIQEQTSPTEKRRPEPRP
jgi:pilus assembly protein CpaB